MTTTEDRIDDSDIGRLWAKHFPKIGDDVGSKTFVLAIVYMIKDKTKANANDGNWSDRILRELRRFGIPSNQFWEIQSASSR